MLEALKCPACAASLEYPKDGSPLLRCPYCNTTIAQDGSAPEAGAGPLGERTLPPLGSVGFRVGLILAVMSVLVIPVIIVIAVVHSINKPLKNAIPKIVTIPMPVARPAASRAAPAPPPPPAFARMVQEFGVEGIGPGRFQDAQSVALDGLGHVYVGEFSGGRVQVFDLQGKFLANWNTGSVKHLLALAADRKGIVYADVAPQIIRFEGMTGKSLGAVDDMNTDVEEFYRAVFCTVEGNVYAIGGNSHIIQFDADAKIKSTIRANDKVGEAVELERLVVEPTGEIYALDHERGILRFAADGRYINRFGSGQGKGHLSSPHNLATDGKGRLYVSDDGPSIRVFDGEGGLIDTFGGNEGASGLAISDSNDIYACFANRHVVRKFVLEKP